MLSLVLKVISLDFHKLPSAMNESLILCILIFISLSVPQLCLHFSQIVCIIPPLEMRLSQGISGYHLYELFSSILSFSCQLLDLIDMTADEVYCI